jgi:hypothetical protein
MEQRAVNKKEKIVGEIILELFFHSYRFEIDEEFRFGS